MKCFLSEFCGYGIVDQKVSKVECNFGFNFGFIVSFELLAKENEKFLPFHRK